MSFNPRSFWPNRLEEFKVNWEAFVKLYGIDFSLGWKFWNKLPSIDLWSGRVDRQEWGREFECELSGLALGNREFFGETPKHYGCSRKRGGDRHFSISDMRSIFGEKIYCWIDFSPKSYWNILMNSFFASQRLINEQHWTHSQRANAYGVEE